jgi:HEAT repeat protein
MMKRWWMVLAVVALVVPAAAQDDFNDETRKLLDEGVTLYRKGLAEESQGKNAEAVKLYKEAYTKLEQALQRLDKVPPDQRKASADLVYAFMERVGTTLIAGMINSSDPQMRAMGYRLLEMAKYGEPFREGKKIALAYVEDLKNDEFAVYRNGHWHLKNYGSWVCRFLVGTLANKLEDKFRSRVMVLLTEMGVDATLSVVECLDAKDAFMKQNAAVVLGNIKDERAIPALKRVYEDPNEKPEVKKFAHEALQKITRKTATDWKKATNYYYELAEKNFYSDPGTIYFWQPYYLVWKWDTAAEKITERRAARVVYNEQLAEEALFDLLDLDPNYEHRPGETAWGLMVMVHFQQILEAEAAAVAALQALKYDEINKETLIEIVRGLEGMSKTNVNAIAEQIRGAGSTAEVETLVLKYFSFPAKALRSNILANLPGRRFLYEALARSMKDKNALLARACIEAIKHHGRPEDLPVPPGGDAKAKDGKVDIGAIGHPLIEALTNEDKRVRYAAAEAMVRLNPQQQKLGMELVIPNLVDALGESGVRVALVIYDVQTDEDRNFINKLRQSLIQLNVFPVIATSGGDGVVKAKSFPTEDVIIIQKKIAAQVYFKETITRKQETENVLRALSQDVRTRNIPRIILSDTDAEMQLAKTEFAENTPWYIKKDTHKLDIEAMLDKIFDTEEAKKDSKHRADLLAKSSAEHLALIDPTNTLYPYRDAVDALIRTVSAEKVKREDFIRIPSALALGIYGDQRAFDVLAKVVGSKAEEQKPVRWQCAKSLSMIFRQTGAAPSKEVYETLLKNCCEDGDYDIEFACGEALGNSKLTPEQRRETMHKRRIKRDTYGPDDDP